jgi:hypothetical protein
MTEYFAIIDDETMRRGPFETISEASQFLKEIAIDRSFTDEEAHQFFLNDSAVVRVETVNGRLDFINIGWLAREKSGRQHAETEEFTRKRERFASAKEALPGLQMEPRYSLRPAPGRHGVFTPLPGPAKPVRFDEATEQICSL